MTPGAETLDLSTYACDQAAAKAACEQAKNWAKAIVDCNPEADEGSVRLVLGEFIKNTLHGDAAVVHFYPLVDGTYLIVSDDKEGQDHIPADCNGHLGTLIIKTLAGGENYRLLLSPNGHYSGYLRIVPQALPAS